MKNILLTLSLALSMIAAQAQTLAPSDIPAAARNHFNTTHPYLAYAPDWKKVGDKYVVEYEVNYVPNFNTYDENGKYLDTRQKTLVKFFPQCVKSYVYSKYAGNKVKHAIVVTTADNLIYYQVETKGMALQFDNKCNLIKTEPRTKEVVSFR